MLGVNERFVTSPFGCVAPDNPLLQERHQLMAIIQKGGVAQLSVTSFDLS